jgi:hypothetical protein
MSDNYLAIKSVLWSLWKGEKIVKEHNDPFKSALSGVGVVGYAKQAASKFNKKISSSNLKSLENSSIFKTAGKAANTCEKATPYLMYANALYNVSTAENKSEAAVIEGSGLVGMTAFEMAFKSANVAAKIKNPVAAAAAFVGLSIIGSQAGQKAAQYFINNDEKTAKAPSTSPVEVLA